MSEKSEALLLADVLEEKTWPTLEEQYKAAAELRRLHEAHECNTAILAARTKRMNELHVEYEALRKQRDALLGALRFLLSYATTLEMRLLDADGEHRAMQTARAAIAKAEGV